MSGGTIDEATLTRALLAFDARHLCLVDRRDLWHLVAVAYAADEISASKAAELLGVPIVAVHDVLAAVGSRG